jgi:hypothetical protein
MFHRDKELIGCLRRNIEASENFQFWTSPNVQPRRISTRSVWDGAL